jgi:glyceraldehyde-3-phosphate dehydrogenase (NADP+)
MCDVWCSFTGGCDTGIAISKKAGMIPLQMELGGKDSCIVLEDADLELAATNIIKGGFSYRFLFTLWYFVFPFAY